jgi:hypothetical protein
MWASLLLLAQADPAAVVERLGSDDFEVRLRAEADLVRLGPAAEAALEKGTLHADREIAARSSRLLDVVAPHRREASAALVHLVAHYNEALSRRRIEDARALMGTLKRVDPGHPLLDDDRCLVSSAASKSYSRMPDRATWTSLRAAVMEAVAATPSPARCVPCARWRLSTMKVGLRFENARVEEILAYLKDLGGLTLVLAEDTRFEHAATISAKEVTLADALDLVLSPYEMAGRLTDEGVLLVERKP